MLQETMTRFPGIAFLDWRQFRLIPGNRQITRENVEKKKKTLLKYGYANYDPIKVTEEGEILDGQNRWQACLELDIEPHWIIVDAIPVEQIAELNQSTVKWSRTDRLYSAAGRGNKFAAKVLWLCKKYGAATQAVTAALSKDNDLVRMPDDVSDDDMQRAQMLLDDIAIFTPIMGTSAVYKRQRLVYAYKLISNMPGFSKTRFFNRVKKYGQQMVFSATTVAEQVRNFVQVYNYNTPDEFRLAMPTTRHK